MFHSLHIYFHPFWVERGKILGKREERVSGGVYQRKLDPILLSPCSSDDGETLARQAEVLPGDPKRGQLFQKPRRLQYFGGFEMFALGNSPPPPQRCADLQINPNPGENAAGVRQDARGFVPGGRQLRGDVRRECSKMGEKMQFQRKSN